MKKRKLPEIGTHITVNHDKGTVKVKKVEKAHVAISAEALKKLKLPKEDGSASGTWIIETDEQ